MNVDTKTQTIIGKATIKPQNELGFFTKINNGLLQYSFGEKRFLLDIEKNTVTELLFSHPENNFSVECKTNSYGHIIKLNGKEIGKYHFQLKNFKCDNNIAGIVKELVVGPILTNREWLYGITQNRAGKQLTVRMWLH